MIDDLEDVLLETGMSQTLVYDSMEKLNAEAGRLSDSGKIISVLRGILRHHIREFQFTLAEQSTLYLFIGVNGVGKTTTIAKFISYLQRIHGVDHSQIVVAAGDTFRAGAIEQLEIHCRKLDVQLVKQDAGADPAAVIFDAIRFAQSRNARYIIADTAGRMNTRKDLLAQLEKIYRVAKAHVPITSFIVLDGNSGLNTLSQVEDFGKIVPLDALIFSKYDGSSKGGVILSIAQQCGVPCLFLGTGEKHSDLTPFRGEEFLNDFLA